MISTSSHKKCGGVVLFLIPHQTNTAATALVGGDGMEEKLLLKPTTISRSEPSRAKPTCFGKISPDFTPNKPLWRHNNPAM